MAISFRSGSATLTTPGADALSIVANCPTAVTGDVRVAMISLNDNSLQTFTAPSGWAKRAEFHHNAVVFDSFELSIWTYTCLGGDPTTALFTATGGVVNQAVICAYQGVDNINPWHTQTTNDGGNAAPTGLSLATSVAGEMVLWLSNNDGALTSIPAGTAIRVDGSTNSGHTGTFVGWYDELFASAGSTGNLVGATSGNNDWIVIMGALTPAATVQTSNGGRIAPNVRLAPGSRLGC